MHASAANVHLAHWRGCQSTLKPILILLWRRREQKEVKKQKKLKFKKNFATIQVMWPAALHACMCTQSKRSGPCTESHFSASVSTSLLVASTAITFAHTASTQLLPCCYTAYRKQSCYGKSCDPNKPPRIRNNSWWRGSSKRCRTLSHVGS